MAGSSSDLHTISQIWLTVQKIHSLSLPDMPGTQRRILARLEGAVSRDPSAKRKANGRKGFEYRADLLPFYAQKELLSRLSDSQEDLSPSPANPPLDLLSELSIHSGDMLFSCPAEMVDDGLNLLSVLNCLVASNGHFVRDDLSRALELAEGLIRAGNSLSKTEGGAE
ncbi:hypothetical protein [Aeromonas sp. SCS5]|uniref:hypothetical protein n=1 Tax=Aeromonas sp. SCS5 TaxID=1519205 RepID=UPI000A521E19|nr:hypothetical protein [Aeromonas sp. SCS5]